MTLSGRSFLAVSAGGAAGLCGAGMLEAGAKAKTPRLRMGICDWSIRAKGRKALELAGSIGLDGVQVSPQKATEILSYSTKAEQDMYRQAVKDTGVQIASIGLSVTNQFPLATDPRGTQWLIQTVDAAAALGCTATLLAFFDKGALNDGKTKQLKKKEVDAVIGKLKEAAPHAKKKGVFLGLENTLSAKDNIAIMDRVGSDAVQVYYDIANSTKNGYDVPAEIRMLKGRICEFHFKNTDGVLGQSGVKCEPIAEAINEIGYKGWLVLERHLGKDLLAYKVWLVLERHFGKDIPAYYKQNAAYIRKLFQLKK